ncbi:MAG: polya polymerase [Lachnospiraceae bacterium]|nr:polya polymerase [Lachnospiraceae bacterium]
MKIQNVKNVNALFQMIDSCKGKVELITGEGDRLNLKSKLCQYVALAGVLNSSEIPEMELIAYEQEDTLKIIEFMGKQ